MLKGLSDKAALFLYICLLPAKMKIIQITPAKDIKQYVHKITVFKTADKIIYTQKLTPSPFVCISYNHYHIPDFKVDNKVISPENNLQVTGPKTSDDIYALHYGRLSQVLIELAPSSFYYLFGQSPAGIVNQTLAICKFIPGRRINELTDSLAENNNYRSHIRKLTNFLVELKYRTLHPIDYIEKAIDLIDKSSGNISVHSVCEQINKSKRQFNRKFSEIIGIPPIQYIKIRQLHFIINLIHLKQYKSIKEIAYDTGFYDPAHFSNSFKKLTGMTPGDFITSDGHIALNYFSELI